VLRSQLHSIPIATRLHLHRKFLATNAPIMLFFYTQRSSMSSRSRLSAHIHPPLPHPRLSHLDLHDPRPLAPQQQSINFPPGPNNDNAAKAASRTTSTAAPTSGLTSAAHGMAATAEPSTNLLLHQSYHLVGQSSVGLRRRIS
jgi:hypothetical protein